MDEVQRAYEYVPPQVATQGGQGVTRADAKPKAKPRRRPTTAEQIEECRARLKRLEAKERERKRKERTRRLIEVGATVEAGVGAELDEDMRRALSRWLAAPVTLRDGTKMPRGEWVRRGVEQEAHRER